jgi:hypothetical protein
MKDEVRNDFDAAVISEGNILKVQTELGDFAIEWRGER